MSWWEPDCSFRLCFCRGPLQKHPSDTAAWLQIEFPIWWESLVLWCFLGYGKIEIPFDGLSCPGTRCQYTWDSVRTRKGCEPWIHRSCQRLIMWQKYVYPKKGSICLFSCFWGSLCFTLFGSNIHITGFLVFMICINIISKHGLNTKLPHEISSNRRDEGFIRQRTVRIDDPLVYPTVDRSLQYCTSTVLHLKCISGNAVIYSYCLYIPNLSIIHTSHCYFFISFWFFRLHHLQKWLVCYNPWCGSSSEVMAQANLPFLFLFFLL